MKPSKTFLVLIAGVLLIATAIFVLVTTGRTVTKTVNVHYEVKIEKQNTTP
jgi:hypothetical protein